MAKRYSNAPNRQHGIGMLTVFIMLSIGIFLGVFAIKVVPEYIEFWTVDKIATQSAEDEELMKQTKVEIYNHLNGAYRHNNLWDLKAEDTIHLKKVGRNKGYELSVNYEKRTQFIHNIYLVTAFGAGAEMKKKEKK